MTTNSTILRIGNSCGVIIPARIMKSLSLSERDVLSVTESDGKIILQKAADAEKVTPFSALDQWYRDNGFAGMDTNDALDYVAKIRAERNNKDIPQW